jgi:Gpi18-like mannosyltransferase
LANYTLVGLNTVLWHLSAILMHLAATLLFYLLVRKLSGEPLVAGMAALLFGIHPAHAEAVAWISGATESLFAIGAFGTILCHMRAREESASRRRVLCRIAALALFAATLLEKETAIILPALVAAYEWIFPPAAPSGRFRRFADVILAAFPYVAIIALYLPLCDGTPWEAWRPGERTGPRQ